MKKILTFAFVMLSAESFAQQQANTNQQLISNFGYGTMIEMKDVNGRPIINKKYDPDIKGSPFLLEEWSDAGLKLINGAQMQHARMRLNIENNELNYLDSANRVIILNKGIIREIRFQIQGSKAADSLVFRNGYPGIDKMDTVTFYQVLEGGAMTFLRYTRKAVAVEKNDLSGEVTKEFVTYTDYYIYFNGSIKPLKRNKQYFLEMMGNKKDIMESYISDKSINFKNIESLQQLIVQFNKVN